jgi:predicted DNA-binding protein with PD1-like motif
MKTQAMRMRPGEDLTAVLENFVNKNHIEAACILTCVGSLRKAVLRYADQTQPVTLDGHFEIVSLTGVLSVHGSHYHIAISDGEGQTIGAHLMQGSEVFTTAEIVLAVLDNYVFLRTMDNQTGYPELEIISK